MKKGIVWLLTAILFVGLFSSCVDVNPGNVAVRVWKRGANAGEIEVLPVGRHDLKIKADDFIFPTYKQNYVWTQDANEGSKNDESLTFPIEGLTIGVDVGIEFSVIPDKVGTIFSEYRMDLPSLTDGPIRNYVRDAILSEVKTYTNMEQFITNNEISGLITKVEENTRNYFMTKGIEVSKVYLVNAPRYPDTVVSSIEAKIEATQKAIQRENELREAEAEAKKQVAEAEGQAQAQLARAKAEAEASALLQKTMTPAILQKMWIEKWDGHLPEVMSGDSELMMNLQ